MAHGDPVFGRVPVVDIEAVGTASSTTVNKVGKRLVRALKDVGWARVKVGDAAVSLPERERERERERELIWF